MKRLIGIAWLVAALGCGGGSGAKEVTYYEDVKAILDQNCVQCHQEGGIGPFALTSYEEAEAVSAIVAPTVEARIMPPWPPASDCQEYEHDRSLSQEEIDTIVAWVDQGALAGDPAAAPEAEPPQTGLESDVVLEMPEPYTPVQAPDDYRCFVIESPWETTRYVTGYNIAPGNGSIVHHVIAFLAPASAADEYAALDEAEEGPGYTCFGGPGGTAQGGLGSWVPGSLGEKYPAGTGIAVGAGDLIVLQVHYNVLENDPAPDLTELELQVTDQVDKPAYVMPWLNPEWLSGQNMMIPADEPDVIHRFEFDPTPFLEQLTAGGIPSGSAIDIHTASLHMHYLGERGYLMVDRQTGGEECLLDVPEWDFNWQGFYTLSEPERLAPGDRLYIECEWDNTASNQPVIQGERLEPQDVWWGEGTTDEMCLGAFYITAAE